MESPEFYLSYVITCVSRVKRYITKTYTSRLQWHMCLHYQISKKHGFQTLWYHMWTCEPDTILCFLVITCVINGLRWPTLLKSLSDLQKKFTWFLREVHTRNDIRYFQRRWTNCYSFHLTHSVGVIDWVDMSAHGGNMGYTLLNTEHRSYIAGNHYGVWCYCRVTFSFCTTSLTALVRVPSAA